ncbi:peptidase S49 family protein [Orientia chuto str. Dubai]|uniref:Peptidase S49 family protein n=1 Tax=Orientia chuto str. Dubai TaxID=1359168 RepID=A0A0F3MMV6_9RICK|nr:S49 family peptidase [Candidatus Orientia mediorientalis]KJV57088.1 peptidase S49 family protein [Orientia chuto str. Dubai]
MGIISKNHANALDKTISQRQPASKIDQLLSCLHCSLLSNKSVVSVINLTGIIGKISNLKPCLTLHALNSVIEKAFSFKKLAAVCLVVNSPGGSPVQSELIANRIIQLSDQKNIPVYSFVEDVAASGGYWLACAGKKIYASKSSIIGSIGVISSGFGLHEAISKLGIKRRVYTCGSNKSILDPFLPEKDSDIKIIKNLQQQVHNHFINYVKSRRGNKITQEDKIIYNGEFWSGEQALEYGLIDGIKDMYSFLDTKYGDSIKIEYVSAKQSWLKKRLGLIIDLNTESIVQKTLNTIEQKASIDRYNLH